MSSSEYEIIASRHVVDRYRQRKLGFSDRRPMSHLVDEIVAAVREAIRGGRVYNHKPRAFGLYGERRRQFPPDEHFILCDDEVGFMLKRLPTGDRVVTTMLTRTGGTPR
jgi:hypothetical protein